MTMKKSYLSFLILFSLLLILPACDDSEDKESSDDDDDNAGLDGDENPSDDDDDDDDDDDNDVLEDGDSPSDDDDDDDNMPRDCIAWNGSYTAWTDPATGLTWQNPYDDSVNLSLADTEQYCADFELEGFTDWRVPTIGDLRTIIMNCPKIEADGACGITDDCLDPRACGFDEEGCKSGGCFDENGQQQQPLFVDPLNHDLHCYGEYIWSSSIGSNYQTEDENGVPIDAAYTMGFDVGFISLWPVTSRLGVICVRGERHDPELDGDIDGDEELEDETETEQE